MKRPDETIVFSKDDFAALLKQHSFAKNGDTYEQKYHSFAEARFPQNEEFWRHFVVPLTNRLNPKEGEETIRFRPGVDDRLQYISGANYSLFVHLCAANELLDKWGDNSVDGIYARLASAFDVFEGVVIQFHLLLYECRGMKSKLVDELSMEGFMKLAQEFYETHYANLHRYYVTVGKKPPPINIPTKDSLFDEFFDGQAARKDYRTISGYIRALRNAIVHDVRVGMLKLENGELLIPKASKVQDYRQWTKVVAIADNAQKRQQDFCEVKSQCKEHLETSVRSMNELYAFMLEQFQNEFYATERSALRDMFGIQFGAKSDSALIAEQKIETADSSSFKVGPTQSPKTETPKRETTGASGIYLAPPKS